MLTESLVPQFVSRARMVNSSSPDWTAPHSASSLWESAPSWRCAPSTFRPLSNISACTTTSIESGWHFTTTGRGRAPSSTLCCCFIVGSWGWTPPYALTKACGFITLESRLYSSWPSAKLESEQKTMSHQDTTRRRLWSILRHVWKRLGPELTDDMAAAVGD